MISSDQAISSAQSYRGTDWYIPPEVYQDESSNIDFVKCDIWALALIVWEALSRGSRYTDDHKVASLLEAWRSSPPKGNKIKEDGLRPERNTKVDDEFLMISEHLCQLAVDFVEAKFGPGRSIHPMSLSLVKQIFRMSLQKDPMKRCGDVSKLPFTYSKHR